VTNQLSGGQQLSVVFSPAVAYARELEGRLGERPHAFAHPFNMIRKMACSFGWDWGPDLQTAGMWRPVRIERWHTARLVTTRPVVDLDAGGVGLVQVHIEVERTASGRDVPLTIQVRLDSQHSVEAHLAAGQDRIVVEMRLPDAPVWWPHGHGPQPLVALHVDLLADEVLDTTHQRIGFRHVELVTEPDAYGTSFLLTVNGKPIEVKGANWIPDDHLLSRVDRPRSHERLTQARDANVNLLRVWGGGIYEGDDFYALCDALGMLVWQEFLLACAAYPEEEPLLGELIAEARENVARLAPHPSLVLWCGGNENLWSRVLHWGPKLHGRTWGELYYREIFPDIVAELSPRTPYVEGSPYSPGSGLWEIPPNDPDHGTMHIWDVWNNVDYTCYRDHVPRFCSEFGFQGPPTWSTMHQAIHDDIPTPTSPGVLAHQKAGEGQEKLARGYAGHFPEPTTFQDWHWTTQLNQARAIAFAIEHFRSHWPRTTGSIVWQLNDCWPVTSWAAIDYEGRLKPLWYALRSAYGPRLLTFQPRGEQWQLAIVNDTDEAWLGVARLRREQFDGTVQWEVDVDVSVPERSTELVELPPQATTPDDPTGEALSAEFESVRAWHVFCEDVDLSYDPAPLRISLESNSDGCRIIVTAKSFTRDVTVMADRLSPEAVATAGLLTLRAGEQAVIDVRADTPVTVDDVDVTAVVRCANDLVHSRADVVTSPRTAKLG
ncbi:MAG: glycoside hydrolase family 2 protein, partial [Arachnia sp.]